MAISRVFPVELQCPQRNTRAKVYTNMQLLKNIMQSITILDTKKYIAVILCPMCYTANGNCHIPGTALPRRRSLQCPCRSRQSARTGSPSRTADKKIDIYLVYIKKNFFPPRLEPVLRPRHRVGQRHQPELRDATDLGPAPKEVWGGKTHTLGIFPKKRSYFYGGLHLCSSRWSPSGLAASAACQGSRPG